MSTPWEPDDLGALEQRLDAWLALQLTDNPVVAAVERDAESGERRWFVRVRGEEKDVFTIWFHLRQRTLHYETYVMPAPEENAGALYEHLLRRNLKRSEEHTSELQSLIRISYAVFCLKKKTKTKYLAEQRL